MGASKTAANVKANAKSQKVPSPPSSVSGTQTSGSGEEKSRHACLQRQLRKTKFCVYHLQGVCHFGANCAFAHSCQEMQRVPDLRKTRICKAFLAGMCENEDCDFAHGEDELRSTDLCYKKTMCSWYEKGCCRNGDSCRFAHGIEELRSAPSTETGSSPTDGITESGSNSSNVSNDSSSRSNSSLKKDGSSKKDASRKAQSGLGKAVNGGSTNGYHMNGVDDFKLSSKPSKAKDLAGVEQRRHKAGKAVVHDMPAGIEPPPGFPEASSYGNKEDDFLQSPTSSRNANNNVSSLDEPMKIEPATAFLGMDRGNQLAMQSLMANGMGGFPNFGGNMTGFGSQVPDPLLGMLGMNASATAGLEAYPNSDEITCTLQGFRQQLESLEATHRNKMAGGEPHTLEKDLSSLITNLASLTNQMSHVEQQMRWNATTFNSAMAMPGGTMGSNSNLLGLDYTPAPFPDSVDAMASEDWNCAMPNANAERPTEWKPQSKRRFNQ